MIKTHNICIIQGINGVGLIIRRICHYPNVANKISLKQVGHVGEQDAPLHDIV